MFSKVCMRTFGQFPSFRFAYILVTPTWTTLLLQFKLKNKSLAYVAMNKMQSLTFNPGVPLPPGSPGIPGGPG